MKVLYQETTNMYLAFSYIFTTAENTKMSYLCNRFWILNVQSLLCVSRHFRDLNNNKLVNKTGTWHSTFDMKMKGSCIDINSFTRYSTVVQLPYPLEIRLYCLFYVSFLFKSRSLGGYFWHNKY